MLINISGTQVAEIECKPGAVIAFYKNFIWWLQFQIFLIEICNCSLVGLEFYFIDEVSLLPNAQRRFQIYCAPPNLGITRT